MSTDTEHFISNKDRLDKVVAHAKSKVKGRVPATLARMFLLGFIKLDEYQAIEKVYKIKPGKFSIAEIEDLAQYAPDPKLGDFTMFGQYSTRKRLWHDWSVLKEHNPFDTDAEIFCVEETPDATSGTILRNTYPNTMLNGAEALGFVRFGKWMVSRTVLPYVIDSGVSGKSLLALPVPTSDFIFNQYYPNAPMVGGGFAFSGVFQPYPPDKEFLELTGLKDVEFIFKNIGYTKEYDKAYPWVKMEDTPVDIDPTLFGRFEAEVTNAEESSTR